LLQRGKEWDGVIRNVLVLGAGAWAGGKVADMVSGVLPRGADGNVNPMVDIVARIAVVGFTAHYALKLLGHRKG
jgi:hypothetical protein